MRNSSESESSSWLEDTLQKMSRKAKLLTFIVVLVLMFFLGVAIREFNLFPELEARIEGT